LYLNKDTIYYRILQDITGYYLNSQGSRYPPGLGGCPEVKLHRSPRGGKVGLPDPSREERQILRRLYSTDSGRVPIRRISLPFGDRKKVKERGCLLDNTPSLITIMIVIIICPSVTH
jgi:hypothetical protein